MNIRFSVLIPVYNTEKYLIQCLESVIDQTYKNFEVIIIDDGSTDSSGLICDSYSDSNIFIVHQKNQGLLMARRNAIKLATGDYCVFLDSDDLLDNRCLEILNQEINDRAFDLIIFNKYFFYEDDINNRKKDRSIFENKTVFTNENKSRILFEFLSTGDLNNLVIKCVKTEILRKDSTNYLDYAYISLSEDRLQSFPILDISQNIEYLDEPLYYYRQNQQSMQHSIDNTKLDVYYKKLDSLLIDKCLEYMNKWHCDSFEEKCAVYKGLLIRKMTSFNMVWDRCDRNSKRTWISYDWNLTFTPEIIHLFRKHKINMPFKQYIQIKSILDNNFLLRRILDLFKCLCSVVK